MQRAALLLISALSLLFLFLHLLNPDVTFDVPSLILLFVAILPWLPALFKELDVPGVGRFVFQEKKKKKRKPANKKRRRKKRRGNVQIIVDEQ